MVKCFKFWRIINCTRSFLSIVDKQELAQNDLFSLPPCGAVTSTWPLNKLCYSLDWNWTAQDTTA